MLTPVVTGFRFSVNPDHPLSQPVPFRKYKDTSDCQLIQEALGDFGSSGGDQDAVKWGICRQAFVPVSVKEYGLVIKGGKRFLGIQE
jgi:hypothetical protein